MEKNKNTGSAVVMRKQNEPIAFPRTVRPDSANMMTTAKAGKTYPAGFIPLFPEDSVSGSVSCQVRMEETVKVLANPVHFRMHAYFVSMAALPRFDGLDSVAYSLAQKVGSQPYVEKAAKLAGQSDFYHAFGEHIPDGASVNTMYLQAYNQVINYRRQQVSISLPQRTDMQATIARSLWGPTALARIVPDFDAALIEGEVALNVVSTTLPVEYAKTGTTFPTVKDGAGAARMFGIDTGLGGYNYVSTNNLNGTAVDALFVDMQNSGLTVSLANLEQAKKTQAFAVLRQQFAGNDDELIDLLMKGLRFPSNAFRDPIHIGTGTGTFGMNQRYASDAANLDDYVVNGAVRVDIPIRVPQQPTGGVIVITYEIIPEPVFDRQADMFLHADFVDLPNALRDHLDTQPVATVPNRFVDALHTTPDGFFGYAPMNYQYIRQRVKVGGRFLRTLAAMPSAEDQQHIWSVRTVNPVLNEDTFLVPNDLAHNVFRDTLLDPFFVTVSHNCRIEGLTQFPPALTESQGDYAAVAAIAPTDIITPV